MAEIIVLTCEDFKRAIAKMFRDLKGNMNIMRRET